LGWTVKGDFWAHEYQICAGSSVIATISKQWFTWGDTYEIDIDDNVDEVMALSVVLIIDAVIDSQNSSSATVSSSGN